MSRFLLLNFEDFGLNQDITKTIQPFNPFCICCLDKDGPMIDLENCGHSDYLDIFGKAEEWKQFNQLVCLQCHSFMRKIKCFQQQILESFRILLSGTYTNSTVNSKRINHLTKQDTPEFLSLPPEEIPTLSENMEQSNSIPIDNNLIGVEIQINSDLDNLNESNGCSELNKNIKTALDILERNNQSFVTLSSQLQFLNGEHLSFLESSLLSKEILSDIPLVPAKNTSTDYDNGLIGNSKLEIEIDGPEKIFYDGLDLSPGLMGTPEMIDAEIEPIIQAHKPKPKIDVKPKIKRKVQKNVEPKPIKTVKLSLDELNKERVRKAQSDVYLKFKFRCETCLIGFNYEENYEDHVKRKHGHKHDDNIICDICSQVIPSSGAMTEHNYRHFIRYDCVQCGKRYPTNDEARRHLIKTHTNNTNKNKTSQVSSSSQ